MQQVKVIKNFISMDDALTIIDYIDKNHLSFSSNMDKKWFKNFFGIDEISKRCSGKTIIDGLGDIKGLSVNIVEYVKDAISNEYDEHDTLFLNSLWFVKHLPGDIVQAHVDVEDQFAYSTVLYLNTLKDGGVLDFPNLNLSFRPEACDLIMFPSHGEEFLHQVADIGEDRYTFPMWFTKDKDLELKFAGEVKK